MTGRPQHVVIVGGGSSGSTVACHLARQPDPTLSITLIDPQDHQIYPPSLIRCLGSLDASPDCWRLSDMFANTPVRYLEDRVEDISLAHREVQLASHRSLPYDHLVLAVGSQPRWISQTDLGHYLFAPTSLADLDLLRERFMDLLDELADEPDQSGRIVILGGGPLGVEVAAECAMLRRQLAQSHRIQLGMLKLELYERGPHILPDYRPETRQVVETWLQEHGVVILTNTELAESDLRVLVLTPSTIGILATGRVPHPLIADLPLRKDREGNLVVDTSLRAHGTERVWVAGDAVSHPHRGHHAHALESGRRIAHHLGQTLAGRPLEHATGHDQPHPHLISLGPRHGVVEFGARTVAGPLVQLVKSWQRRRDLGLLPQRSGKDCRDCQGSRLSLQTNV